MLSHLIGLLVRSFHAIPTSLGSTWLGMLFPLFGFLVAQVVSILSNGWSAMRADWRRNLVRGAAVAGIAWAGLFAWCVVATTYQDHEALAARVGELRKTVDKGEENKKEAIRYAVDPLTKQLVDLKQSCAETKGANGALERQNKDQQNSINNCQNQAIKLLRPEPFQWRAVALEEADISPQFKKQRWLLLANKDVSPAEFTFYCDSPIIDAEAKIAGSAADVRTVRLDKERWGAQVRSPAWGPNSPALIITTLSLPAENTTCHFNINTVVK